MYEYLHLWCTSIISKLVVSNEYNSVVVIDFKGEVSILSILINEHQPVCGTEYNERV